ncbi:MAG: S41 family peptidase, partial [Bacteroidota bacterium]
MKTLIKTILIIQLLFLAFSGSSQGQIFNDDIYKFGKALHYIDNYYIDSVDRSSLVEDALISMLKELDPHTTYLTKEEVKEMNEPLQGNFEGIGIQFNIHNDTIYVISAITGGPSEKVGIKAGDRIVKIEGENVAGTGITNQGVRDRLLGEKGTKVDVDVKRAGVDKLLHFTITRDEIPIHSRDAAYMAEDNIGYIKLNRFAKTTNEEFTEAAEDMKDKGANSLILDLRGNSGGYLQQAIELADEFLGKDRLIVYTEGRKVEREDNHATEEGVFKDGNIIILIDEGSASASEIVAGAIQDWDRGIIIGRRSFGKGLVQRPVELPDGSMIRLTIARYHTPTGRAIQKPYNENKKEYNKELLKRYNEGEMVSADSIDLPDSLKYLTKTAERPVYGGGGIMPDIFIPVDTTGYSDYYSDLIRGGVLNSFILDYIDDNRKELNKSYPEFEKYQSEFTISEKILSDLYKYAEKEDLEPEEEEIESSEKDIKTILKALIARDLWDMNEYFQVVNKQDKEINRAIEVLKNWEDFSEQYLKK